MRRTRRFTHFSYANVMATIAVFMALGGGAYAAVKLPPNVVKERNIAADAVTSAEVKDHSLLAKDFRDGQLPRGEIGATGPTGATGRQGIAGPKGAPGTNGMNGTNGTNGTNGVLGYHVEFEDFTMPTGVSHAAFDMRCGSGNPLGGGGHVGNDLTITTNIPLQSGSFELGVATLDGKVTTAPHPIRIEIACGH